jgi:hypothetical protein
MELKGLGNSFRENVLRKIHDAPNLKDSLKTIYINTQQNTHVCGSRRYYHGMHVGFCPAAATT